MNLVELIIGVAIGFLVAQVVLALAATLLEGHQTKKQKSELEEAYRALYEQGLVNQGVADGSVIPMKREEV